ncbi:MAG TPA: hypothetical protein DCY20_11480 [Firmicutes bacterium]|nr:hypothetical protein [Bacillota bacterium]
MVKTITHTSEQVTITLCVTELGNDLNVSLYGGDKPHIGAVALAVPHESLADANQLSATVSTLVVMRHKEEALAKDVAYQLSKTLNKVVSVSCGIHIDNIKPEQFTLISELVSKCINEYLTK